MSPAVHELELAEDLAYCIASMEPFAHFIGPGMRRGESEVFLKHYPYPTRTFVQD